MLHPQLAQRGPCPVLVMTAKSQYEKVTRRFRAAGRFWPNKWRLLPNVYGLFHQRLGLRQSPLRWKETMDGVGPCNGEETIPSSNFAG